MWARNCWYVIAWEHEIPAVDSPKLFTRTLLNEPILVYRTAGGGLVAMEDRCPHRHAPLSAGRREGDAIRCGYHGLKFNAQGLCVEVPGMERAPEKVCTRTYPLVSKNNWVFVWMGEDAKADVAMLPDNFSCASAQWQHHPGYMHYQTPYLLICDNLLDFSHLSYVHEKTLGGSTAIAQSRPVIEAVTSPGQRGIKVTRHVSNVPAPPFYQRFQPFTTNLDRWFVYEFLMPGTLLMHSGGRPVADAVDDMSNAVQLHSCQTLSPETENSTHYFFQQSHQTGRGDATVTQSIFDSLLQAFEEDRAMITAQHVNMRHQGARPMVPLHVDSALIQFRKLVAREVEAER